MTARLTTLASPTADNLQAARLYTHLLRGRHFLVAGERVWDRLRRLGQSLQNPSAKKFSAPSTPSDSSRAVVAGGQPPTGLGPKHILAPYEA